MDNYSNIKSKTIILIDDYIKRHEIGEYVQNIVFDNDLISYACYNYITKEIILNLEKIYLQINQTFGNVEVEMYLSVLRKVILHEIRHAVQRKIVDEKEIPISMLYSDSFNNKTKVSDLILPTENNAILYSYFYELWLLYCKNECLEHISEKISIIKCLIDKIYKKNIPTKEFYLQLECYKKYLYLSNHIVDNFVRLLNGFDIDEMLLIMIENSISEPLILKKELNRGRLFR